MTPPKPLDKVDRALEMQVIDWLQWSEFGADERLAALALELIAKRTAFNESLLKEAEALREALEYYQCTLCHDETGDCYDYRACRALARFDAWKEGKK